MRTLRFIFVGVLLLFSYAASANDSTARVGVGGLELQKTDDIQMVSEVLEISIDKVRVVYHFLNTSDKDLTTIVAFPMPAFWQTIQENIRPLDTFQMQVNGKNVVVHKSRKLLIGNVDVTEKYRKIGLTDNQIFDPGFYCMDDPFPGNPCTRTENQLAAIREIGRGIEGTMKIQETAYWEQTFPAGKDIEVIHEYKPFAGIHYGRPEGDAPNADCLDNATRKLIARRRGPDNYGPQPIEDVEYILGTGRNWQGPIRNFRLILRKESPNDVVSLCFPGTSKKTSPTTIEFSRTNYVPQDKLIVYFYLFH